MIYGELQDKKLTDHGVFMQSAHVAIKISDRSKMDPGSSEREVSISGLYGAVKLAEAMISEKLNQSRARANSRNDDDHGHHDSHDA